MITFREVLDHAGLEPRSYSGRGMGGQTCVAVYTEDMGRFFASVLSAIEDRYISERKLAIDPCAVAFKDMHTDQLGKGTIVYFPTIPWTDT